MTTPIERMRSLRFAEELIRDLLNPDKYPDLPSELRSQAVAVLRHYPDKRTREDLARRDAHVQGFAASYRLLESE